VNEIAFDVQWRPEGSRASLADIAYERIEELFVMLRLQPGASLRMQDVQTLVGLGRTPVHLALRRLAAETLFQIRPRDGLSVATIDLSRERRLARLRHDLDRFVVEEATKKATSNHRSRLGYLRRKVTESRDSLTLEDFNRFDRSFDLLLMDAAGERFLERALRPLHAFARRTGYLNLSRVSGQAGLDVTIDRHLELLDAVVAGQVREAKAASDALVEFSISLIDGLEETVDPGLLDARFSTAPAH